MSKGAVLPLIAVVLIACILVIPPAKASPRTIVVPDDYQTIAAAVGNATDGDTILVRRGTYDGPWNKTLFINKSISLIGEDAATTKLILHPAWVTQWIISSPISGYIPSMQIDAKNVTLGGFTLLSDGWEIVVNGNGAQILSNVIMLRLAMKGSHQTVAYNTITSSRYPNGTFRFYASADLYGSYNIAAANILADGSINAYGTFSSFFANKGQGSIGVGLESHSNLIYENILKDGGGIWVGSIGNIVAKNTVTNGTNGINIVWGSDNVVMGNTVSDCSGTGLTEFDNAGNNTFSSNHVENTQCGAKIAAWRSYNTSLYHNNFVNNVKQVNCDATEDYTTAGMTFTRQLTHGGLFDDGSEGNYWSDYTGADADGDGIGDTPYVIDENRSDHFPLMALFDVSSVTVQLPEWANLTLSSSLQTNSFPPAPSPSPSPTPFSTPTPTPSPSLSPTASPPEAEPESFSAALVTTASGVTLTVAGISLLVYFKKRRREAAGKA